MSLVEDRKEVLTDWEKDIVGEMYIFKRLLREEKVAYRESKSDTSVQQN